VSVGSTRIDTLPMSSRSSRSLICARHELPVAAGERRGIDAEDHRHRRFVDRDRFNRNRFSASAIVSPIMMSSMPARQMMSPAAASIASIRLRPSNV
jgi:hypothetical protein